MDALPDRLCLHCGTKLAQDATVCTTCGNLVPEPLPPSSEQPVSSPSQDNPDGLHAVTDQSPTPSPPDEPVSQNDAAPLSMESGASPPPQDARTAADDANLDDRPYRSGCMTVLAWLISLQAFFIVIVALIRMLFFLYDVIFGSFSNYIAVSSYMDVGPANIAFLGLTAVVGGIVAVVITRLAWGLWTVRLRPWVFWTGLIVEIFLLVIGVLNFWEESQIEASMPATSTSSYGCFTLLFMLAPLLVLIGLPTSGTVRFLIRKK